MKVSCLISMLLLLDKWTYQKQIEGFKVFGGIFFPFLLLFFLLLISFYVILETNAQISKIRYTSPLLHLGNLLQ